MRFQVPQFIEVEDKVIGPLTFKQFIYLAGGGGLSFLLWIFLPTFVALPLILGVVALSVALAFYKINNKPFIDFLAAGFRYITTSKLYIWNKEEKKATAGTRAEAESTPQETLAVPKLSDSKLRDLSWSLDVHEDVTSSSQPLDE